MLVLHAPSRTTPHSRRLREPAPVQGPVTERVRRPMGSIPGAKRVSDREPHFQRNFNSQKPAYGTHPESLLNGFHTPGFLLYLPRGRVHPTKEVTL